MNIAGLSLPGRLIDRYLLGRMVGPLLVSLALVLSALLIERVLRLLDLIASQGGSMQPVLTMAASLLPHYLGLALPAAFFLSVLTVAMRLSENSEIDALQSSGLPLRRLVLPFVVIGLVLAVVSVALFGYLQPYARYSYRAALNTVTASAWVGPVSAGRFIDAGRGVVFHVARTGPDGQGLEGIFIEYPRSESVTDIITARYGALRDDPVTAGGRVLVLHEGQQLRIGPSGTTVLRFDQLVLHRDMLDPAFFRPRGRDERELTLDELWSAARSADGPVPSATMQAELHGRLVRAASLALLPLLAVPMGVAAKRRRRGAGIVVSALILVFYHHALQFGQGLVEAGRLSAMPAVWLPFAAFALSAGWVLLQRDRRAGQGPLDGLLDTVEDGLDGVRGWFGRRRGTL